MNKGVVLACLSAVAWALTSLLMEGALDHFQPLPANVLGIVGETATGFLLFYGAPGVENWKGIDYGILGGVASGLGILALCYGMSVGPVTVVVPIAALYPGLTAIWSYLFQGAVLKRREIAGILLALTAVTIISI